MRSIEQLQLIGGSRSFFSVILPTLLLGVSGAASPSVGQQQERFAGAWVGAVECPSGPMDIEVVLTAEAGGALRGTFFNSEGVGHPIRMLRTWGDSLSFGMIRDPTFFGEMREDRITGIAKAEGHILPFHLSRDPDPPPGRDRVNRSVAH